MPPKRKKRFHGLYYHSSPPRVLPMNAQAPVETKKKSADDFSIRLSTIRIWMHEKDIGKLTRVLWAGQGNRLRQQASTNPKVKRFLAAVPYVMNSIKDVHQSVVDNSLETLQATMESNVPPTLITCKDANGLNVVHKAAGLGHTMMLEYLLSIWPDGAHETDMTGKTALHWAASAKNNMRCYTLLTQAGCEEDALDYKMKTPLYYKQKHNEIERSFLTQVPEAPRVSQDIPVDWEALASDDSDDKKKPEIIIPNGRRKSDILGNSVNLLTSRSEANSIENTSEPDLFQGDNANEEDHSEPPPEESESTDALHQPLENGHVMNSEVDISESDPASPPKTPEETENENEVENMEDQPEKLSEDENVGNALNDQNNNDEKAVNEAEHKENDSNGENSGEEKIDVDEDHKDADHKESDSNGKNSGEDKIDVDEGSEKEETKEEEIKESDQKNEDHTNEEEKDAEEENAVKKEIEAQEDNKHNEEIDKNGIENEEEEKTDVTDSIKGNNETHNDDGKPKEQINCGEEEVKIESVDGTSVEENTKNFEKEDDNEKKSSSPLTEKTQEDDIKSEENQSEEPQAEENQSEDSQSKDNQLESASTDEPPLEEQLETASQPETDLKEQQPQELATLQTPLEQSSPEELVSENSQPERPESKKSRTGSACSEKSHPKQIEKNTNQTKSKKNNDSKNEESNGKDTDDEDDDDDDQDLEIKPIDTPQQYQQPHQTNHSENNLEFDDKMTSDSPTSSMAIEGFVRGDSEDNQVQSESAAYLDDEEQYIEAIINSGDMEQLAALVLNGDGKKILNRTSSKPEIQAFLTNVPAYMDKISRVHEAARQGTLYQLQAALDRRKFAIAKDENSPCGASPLHVAVLFGHSDIVRYLAGRFPETTSAVDDDGRTALHYAATINDNGHFFNLLSHLGGNPKATDKLGNTAEFYMNDERAKDVLTYRQLLKRFGSEELEDEMLNDQGKSENYTQNAIFKTEQGKYLASSLGDPLIKGLTEIADKRPIDPVAYLAGFLQNFIKNRNSINDNNNNNNNNNNTNNNTRDNDTGDTDSTALANSDAEIISTPSHVNRMDSPAETEEHLSSPETTPKKEDRDEHGQSMLHFACARSHRRNGLLNLIEESQIDVTYRDELYRTARDVSLQANQPGNAKEIDRFVLSLAVVGDTKPFEHMAIAGYDHILDVVDDEGTTISDVAESRGHDKLVEFFDELRFLEGSREELHQATRNGDFERIKEITSSRKGKWLIKAKNYYGRNAMHIAVLKELEETVEYFVNTCPDALKIGDNLERTPLHYAMGTNSVESVSRILIRKGAKRTTKDLKGRQPSYYFINKADIMRLQEEEDEHR